MKAWALFYASIGWAVFPLVAGTKSPLAGSRGSSEATTDRATIEAWWTEHPNANIGMNPHLSGLYVLDVDPRNGGHESFAALNHAHGGVLASPLVNRSGRGEGFHLFFKARPGATYYGQPGKGLDGKHKGFVVLPPSLHPATRQPYTWDGQPQSAVLDLAPAFLERVAVDRPVNTRVGSHDDIELIREALKFIPNDGPYHDWLATLTSLHHWGTHSGLESDALQLAIDWSEGYAGFDAGEVEHKWSTFDSDKPGARTLGSLLKDAEAGGLVRGIDPAKVGFGVEPRAVEWTTCPVARFTDRALDHLGALEDLSVRNNNDFLKAWEQPNIKRLIGDLAWRGGSNCQLVLDALLLNPAITDTPELRQGIAERCAAQLTHWGVAPMTELQAGIAGAGLAVTVEVDEGNWVQAEADCLAALPHINNVFKRDGALVWVNARGGVTAYDIHRLSSRLEAFLDFVKGKGKPSRLPEALGQRIIRNQDFPGVGELTAAIPLPSVRADGTVISEPGLDAATGLYLLGGLARPVGTVDLRATLARIWAPFAEFPFTSDAARGAMLSALLTGVCRVSLTSAPAFFVNAQAPGTGKSKLSECIMLAATGSTACLAMPKDAAEQAKTLVSVLRGAPRGLMFDNLSGTLQAGDTFCSVITSPEYQSRGLGGMDMLTVVNRALWVLNGNNVIIKGDAVRRLILIGLDSPERPETALHDFDPVRLVRGNLASYRADLIDVLDAYRAAGMPQPGGGLASFDEWNTLVRGAVVWVIGQGLAPAPMADPVQTILDAAAEDPDVLKREMFTAAWLARFGTEPVKLRDVTGVIPGLAGSDEWQEAYEGICRRDGKINPDLLAYWLRTNKGRITEGFRFVNSKQRSRANLWRLEQIT